MVLQSSYRDEQSLHHITMVQIFWSQPTMVLQMQQKKAKKNWTVGLSCEWLHSGKKMVAHTFHLSLDNANHFKNNNCRDSENFATMATWHQSSLHETVLVSEMELMITFILGWNSWESWCNHFWTHGIHVI